jgi:hypothetical protein
MAQTLEELKEENKKNEEQQQSETVKATDSPSGSLDTKGKSEVISEDADLPDEDESLSGLEIFSQDDQTSDDDEESEAKFTDSDIAAVRRKLKGKLKEEQEKSTTLEQEIAELRSKLESVTSEKPQPSQQTAQQPSRDRMPKLADYGFDEDAYEVAMARWVQTQSARTFDAVTNQTAKQQAEQAARQKTEQSLDDHYRRAITMVDKVLKGDSAVYQRADTAFRAAIEEVFPHQGDPITDGIIARLGEGSEEVIFHLGQNKQKRAELISSLREDPSGVSAAIMLGAIKTQINSSKKKTSSAPSPSSRLSGDAVGGQAVSKLKRKYDSASGNDAASVQKRIDIRREAKRLGADVSGW